MQLTATAHFSNGTTSNVTQTAEWQSFNAAVATVTPMGRFIAHRVGDVRIRAALQTVEDVKEMGVFDAFIVKGRVEEAPLDRGSARLAGAIVEAERGQFRTWEGTSHHAFTRSQ